MKRIPISNFIILLAAICDIHEKVHSKTYTKQVSLWATVVKKRIYRQLAVKVSPTELEKFLATIQ
jgi:hypothetical protein